MPRVPDSAVRRLSLYVRCLEGIDTAATSTISSRDLATAAGTTAAQVRKDLSRFGSFGKRGLGYPVDPLLERLRTILGLNAEWPVMVVGAGRIGSALHAYPYFRERGFRIVAVLDDDPVKVGSEWNGTTVEHVDQMEAIICDRGVKLLVLAVPAPAASGVALRAARAGIRGILNFAPARLEVPDEVVVNDVNLALEMEALAFALSR
ncbi:MAG: redox-sensing transcriptional repressor Rex [Gemmatimonadales bacterium]|nr:MAG: redox-sensing transcriptional repressor Rex [Gemmatimonadales bacterium]